MIDNKGRLFSRINIVDLLIALLILAAVAVTVYKFGYSSHKDVNKSDIKIEYVLKIEGVRDFTLNAMDIGAEIYDEETKKFLGVITAIDNQPAKDHITKSNGEIVYGEKENRYDVYVTAQSDAREINNGYFANGNKEIGVYSNIKITSQKFACTSEVISVKKLTD